MARDGDVFEIPLIGHRFRILQGARETGGESLRLEYCAPPRGKASEHIHPLQEARLKVVSGTLDFRLGANNQSLAPVKARSDRPVSLMPGATSETSRCASSSSSVRR